MTSLFDRTTLMDRIGNDEHVLRELVDLFLDLQPQRMNQLAHAVASEELELARGYAHTLAGAFRSVSMPLLGDLAKALELAAGRDELEDCGKLFQELDGAFARVMVELRTLQATWLTPPVPAKNTQVAA
jgi:HPt (histidine-containing phosphotransfer) domain-containing protein